MRVGLISSGGFHPQRRTYRHRLAIGIALGAAAFIVGEGRAARGQTTAGSGFAVDRFEPAGAGSDWFTLESLDFRGRARPAFNLVLDGAWKPLVVYDQNGNAVASLLRDQLVAHAGAAVVLADRVRLDVNVPVVLYQQGTALVLNNLTYGLPPHSALGDTRLGLDVRLFGQGGGRFIGALGVQVFAPTGDASRYTGDGGWRVWPRALLAGNLGEFSWAARFGYHIRPTLKCDCSLGPGDELTAAVAAGVRASPRVLIGPELYLSSARTNFGVADTSPVEVLVGGHFGVARGWMLSIGARARPDRCPRLSQGARPPRGAVRPAHRAHARAPACLAAAASAQGGAPTGTHRHRHHLRRPIRTATASSTPRTPARRSPGRSRTTRRRTDVRPPRTPIPTASSISTTRAPTTPDHITTTRRGTDVRWCGSKGDKSGYVSK